MLILKDAAHQGNSSLIENEERTEEYQPILSIQKLLEYCNLRWTKALTFWSASAQLSIIIRTFFVWKKI